MLQEPVRAAGVDAVPAPGHPARAAPLNRAARAFLPCAQSHHESRRHAEGAGPLSGCCWDGDARGSWDPRRGPCKRFCVPLRASSLGIVADDAESARLLAVVLSTPEEMAAHGAPHLAVTLDGGQTVAIDVMLSTRSWGQGYACVLQLADTEPAAVLARVGVITVIVASFCGDRAM